MMNQMFRTTAYRYPNERLILAITLFVVLVVIALTATATVCTSLLFVLGILGISYGYTRSQTRALIENAQPVTSQNTPALAAIAEEAGTRLQVDPVQIFVVPSRILNAYTFGMSSPKIIVLHSILVNIMDRDEMGFIIGHEMGHVCLGHTRLNSLVGGLAGIPSPSEASLLLALAFRWWNRACEYSADRAGMLSSSNPQKAISALVKLEAETGRLTPDGLQRALASIEAEDHNLMNNMEELFATHPMIVRRIEMLRSYAASSRYQQLKTRMEQNLFLNRR